MYISGQYAYVNIFLIDFIKFFMQERCQVLFTCQQCVFPWQLDVAFNNTHHILEPSSVLSLAHLIKFLEVKTTYLHFVPSSDYSFYLTTFVPQAIDK